MKTALSLKVFSLSALMLLSVAGTHSPLAAAAEPSQVRDAASTATPTAKTKKPKVKKAYSKATLSVLQPVIPQSQISASTAFSSAAGIALSPVVNKDVVQPLVAESAAVLPVSGSLSIATEAANQGYDEESSLAQHEMPAATVTESDALGQESVSVVDRFADKPKAKPITEGPLRVKMKDSGLRASVQIPLTQVLQ